MRRYLPADAGARPPHRTDSLPRHAAPAGRSNRARRDGMTLLEVIIALAIFMLSIVAIQRLILIGTDRARDVQLRAEAIRLCQSKMAEIYAGAEQLQSQSDVPFTEDPVWHWSADCNQGNVNNLWTVEVRVGRDRADGTKLEVTLTQMMLDPSVRGTNVNLNSNSSGSSGSSSGSTTGGM
jgi:type II secretion system protein I